jgi:hypothetical protein
MFTVFAVFDFPGYPNGHDQTHAQCETREDALKALRELIISDMKLELGPVFSKYGIACDSAVTASSGKRESARWERSRRKDDGQAAGPPVHSHAGRYTVTASTRRSAIHPTNRRANSPPSQSATTRRGN